MEFSAPIAVALADNPGLAALTDLFAKPDPQTAWLLALGFLGIVVLRRTRPGPMN
jgi:hypothetical protein